MTSPTVRIGDLREHGVTLISPEAAEFDDLARPLIGALANRILKMKPFMVIVENHAPLPIVAFSVEWHVVYSGNRRTTSRTQYKHPAAICGDQLVSRDEGPVLPGCRRVVASGCRVEGVEEIRRRHILDALDVAIQLDAVVFEDGCAIGTDDAGLVASFSTYVAAKQAWYRRILLALEAGCCVEEAFSPVKAHLDEWRKQMAAGHRPDARAREATATRQAAAEAWSWRSRFTDAEIPALLRKSVRLDPFIVKRIPSRVPEPSD